MSKDPEDTKFEIQYGRRIQPTERFFAIMSRIIVWGLLFSFLYLLRSFFLLLFLTFIFSYIQSHTVDRVISYFKSRTLSVVAVGVSFLVILTALTWFVVPQIVEQSRLFADRHRQYVHELDQEILDTAKGYPVVYEALLSLSDGETEQTLLPKKSISVALAQAAFGIERTADPEQGLKHAVILLKDFGQSLFSLGSTFLLALLFSFLIVFDLPRLTKSVLALEHTRLSFVYQEVAQSIYDFAAVVGRAFQAQSIIALVNTALTAIAIYILGLQASIAFLCLIVFVGSFVPVAGVFVSSIPICLMALQRSGSSGVLLAIGLICFVHIIETYVVNPRIFGEKLKVNPVLVLIILTVAGKLFHIWGLLLSLPIVTYIFGTAIRHQTEESESSAELVEDHA